MCHIVHCTARAFHLADCDSIVPTVSSTMWQLQALVDLMACIKRARPVTAFVLLGEVESAAVPQAHLFTLEQAYALVSHLNTCAPLHALLPRAIPPVLVTLVIHCYPLLRIAAVHLEMHYILRSCPVSCDLVPV
jgi:hypothetical protein